MNLFKNIFSQFWKTVQRFKLASLMALFGSVFCVLFVHDIDTDPLPRIFMTILLAFPLFIGASLFQPYLSSKKINILLYSAIFIFLGGYYLYLPNQIIENNEIYFFRAIIWELSFLIFIPLTPFFILKSKYANIFWEFIKNIFLSLCRAGFLSFSLFLGILGIFWSIDSLFEINIHDERYFENLILCFGIICPLFFLSGIPHSPRKLKIIEPAKFFHIFTHYLLLPLTIVYFIILYTYTGKILITQEWPSGIVAIAISLFSFVGFITHFCITSFIPKNSKNALFGKIFSYALLPQIIILFTSLYLRINQYGITEKRFLLGLFGLWLSFTAIFFIWKKRHDFRIPIAFFCFLLFTFSVGPWSIFEISKTSQTNILESLLIKNNILTNGQVKKLKDVSHISFEDKKEISAKIDYLNNVHGLKHIQRWFSVDLKSFGKINNNRYRVTESVINSFGFSYISKWDTSESKYFNYSLNYEYPKVITLNNYDYLLDFNDHERYENNKQTSYYFNNKKLKLSFNFKKNSLIINNNLEQNIITINLTQFLENLYSKQINRTIPIDFKPLNFQNNLISGEIKLENLSGSITDNNTKNLESISFKVLISFPSNQ